MLFYLLLNSNVSIWWSINQLYWTNNVILFALCDEKYLFTFPAKYSCVAENSSVSYLQNTILTGNRGHFPEHNSFRILGKYYKLPEKINKITFLNIFGTVQERVHGQRDCRFKN